MLRGDEWAVDVATAALVAQIHRVVGWAAE